MNMPQAPPAANILDEGGPVPENAPPSVVEANAEANRAEQIDGVPVPRFPDFRFFIADGSARERQLETRLDLLEQRLEATDNRLRFSDSASMRIDAELDRARLERDLETVSSEIRRMRLERVFARPPADAVNEARPPQQPVQPAGGIPPEAQSSEPTRLPGLNLIA
jgi:hypothetical protein